MIIIFNLEKDYDAINLVVMILLNLYERLLK